MKCKCPVCGYMPITFKVKGSRGDFIITEGFCPQCETRHIITVPVDSYRYHIEGAR
jgi:hypothetical protein